MLSDFFLELVRKCKHCETSIFLDNDQIISHKNAYAMEHSLLATSQSHSNLDHKIISCLSPSNTDTSLITLTIGEKIERAQSRQGFNVYYGA